MHPFCAPGGLARHGLRLVSQADADGARPAGNIVISRTRNLRWREPGWPAGLSPPRAARLISG